MKELGDFTKILQGNEENKIFHKTMKTLPWKESEC